MKLSATTATPYSKLTAPFPGRCTTNFRVDAASGHVRPGAHHQEVPSESSDEEDTPASNCARAGRSLSTVAHGAKPTATAPNSSAASVLHGHLATEPTGESLAHTLGVALTPCPFMRPKIMSTGIRCAPSPSANGTMTTFFDEGKLVLFGGCEGIKALNDTWVYRIADRRWQFVDPMEVAQPALTARRQERGFSGERLPPPRCGHSAVAVRDIPTPSRIDPASLKHIEHDSVSSDSHQPAASTAGKAAVHSFVPYQPAVLIFGGADLARGLYFNDLWVYDVELAAWKEIKPGGRPPCERWHHSSCVLEQRMFVYGGESSEFEILDDLHMFDYTLSSWRPLRTTQPIPPGRMLHASCVSAEEMIVVGGVGSQAKNVALLDIAVDQGIHLAGTGHIGGGRRRSSASHRRPSEGDIEAASQALQAHVSEPLKMSALAAKFKAELSDVWVLNLRTLHWRQVGGTQKRFSPFVVREDALLRGPPIPVNGSDSGPKLPPPYGCASAGAPLAIELKSLEGHVALPFNERILVMGGKLGGRLNRRLFALHLPSETWAYLGELPANMSSDQQRLPLARSGMFGAAMVERRTLSSMRDAVSLNSLDEAKRHVNEVSEMEPLVQALAKQLASQLSFTGSLSIYGIQPIVSKTVCAYFFGGISSSGKPQSDTWCLELTDASADRTHEELFGKPMDLLLQGLQGRAPEGGNGTRLNDEDVIDEDDEVQREIASYVLGPKGNAVRGGRDSTTTADAALAQQRNRNGLGQRATGPLTASRKGLLSGTSTTTLDIPEPHGRGSGQGSKQAPLGRRSSRMSDAQGR